MSSRIRVELERAFPNQKVTKHNIMTGDYSIVHEGDAVGMEQLRRLIKICDECEKEFYIDYKKKLIVVYNPK